MADIATGELRLIQDKRRVLKGGTSVALTAKEYDLLLHFARHPGKVFSRSQSQSTEDVDLVIDVSKGIDGQVSCSTEYRTTIVAGKHHIIVPSIKTTVGIIDR